jgi:hypothetical protein
VTDTRRAAPGQRSLKPCARVIPEVLERALLVASELVTHSALRSDARAGDRLRLLSQRWGAEPAQAGGTRCWAQIATNPGPGC